MRTIEIDYRYLLRSLIPHNRLPHNLRQEIREALVSKDAADLRRCALLTLDRLDRDAYLTKTDTVFINDHVSVSYAKNNGIYRFNLTVPRDEWIDFTGESADSNVIDVSDQRSTTTPQAPAASSMTVEILPDVLRSLSINDRHDSMVSRLDALMDLIPEWLRFREASILIVRETIEDLIGLADHVQGVGEAALLEKSIYHQIMSSGDYAIIKQHSDLMNELIGDFQADRSVAVVPIFASGEFRGAMHLSFGETERDNSIVGRIDIAKKIVEQVITINDKIENITSIDALTGIYNRHFYDTQLPIEIERATRTASKLSMLLLDIDDFKKINDTLGHKKGDEALSLVAGLIKNNLRKIDLPFRYGGEEFAILLPGTSEIEAVHTAERLRTVISAYTKFENNEGKSQQITVSVGVAVFPDHARTEEELFVKADTAMFRAKHRGKNRVELFGE
jgi:diguanylate cyclase (GGDEF)-like protein